MANFWRDDPRAGDASDNEATRGTNVLFPPPHCDWPADFAERVGDVAIRCEGRAAPAVALEDVVTRLDGGAVAPGDQLVAIDGDAVFDATKRKYWRDVLEATTTHTPPPPDEYDRPEELREFVVDRLRATKAPLTDDDDGDEAARLARREHPTVFGQLRNQLRGVRPAQLRRAFVHMQDGGQPRAFYVKFVGEGVDDHGGPYRATFQAALRRVEADRSSQKASSEGTTCHEVAETRSMQMRATVGLAKVALARSDSGSLNILV